ncbi:sulfatase-like hydrolase/transferase [Rhizobium leguminosarum]
MHTKPLCDPDGALFHPLRDPIGGGIEGLTRWEVTLAETLSTAGYATAAFGKWHLGSEQGRLPNEQGFDEWYGIPRTTDEAFWPDEPQAKPLIRKKNIQRPGSATPGRQRQPSVSWSTSRKVWRSTRPSRSAPPTPTHRQSEIAEPNPFASQARGRSKAGDRVRKFTVALLPFCLDGSILTLTSSTSTDEATTGRAPWFGYCWPHWPFWARPYMSRRKTSPLTTSKLD